MPRVNGLVGFCDKLGGLIPGSSMPEFLPGQLPVSQARRPLSIAAGAMSGRRVAIAAIMAVACAASATAENGELAPVRIEQDGLKLELAPLTPDQVRAFFLARGFTAQDAEHIVATGCVFRSAIGSAVTKAGEAEVSIALAKWRVQTANGASASPKVREDWEAVWKARGVAEEAATAFYWALFPTEQTFFPSDYNWGFLTFGLPAGTAFDLTLAWSTAGEPRTKTLKGLQCAK